MTHRVDSEVGQLTTVMLHRPGPELARLTPRNNDSLLFDGIPWVQRAQEEHDIFAGSLRNRGVTVLYLADLLAETLTVPAARTELTDAVLSDVRLGESLRASVAAHLAELEADGLARVLMAGLAHEELRTGTGLVYALMDRLDFVIDPLPNLLFTRDSSVWIGGPGAVPRPPVVARRPGNTPPPALFPPPPPVPRTRHPFHAPPGVPR